MSGGSFVKFKLEDAGSVLSVYDVPREKVIEDIKLAFALDREGKIRQALIEMGWSPPSDQPRARSAAEESPNSEGVTS